MRLTDEQKKVFEGYIGLLNAKIGLKVEADKILNDMYEGLDKVEADKSIVAENDSFDEDDSLDEELAEQTDFKDAYMNTYSKALANQVIPGIVDKVSEGEEVPDCAGTYLGAAMDYLFRCLADEKTKENDNLLYADKLLDEAHELKQQLVDLRAGLKRYEKSKLEHSSKVTKLEAASKDPDNDEVVAEANKELEEIEKEEQAYKKNIQEIEAKSKECINSSSKLKTNNPHHIDELEYNRMITEAFQVNTAKLDSIPRYKYLADEAEANEADENGYSQKDIDTDVVRAQFGNLIADIRSGDLTAEEFKKYIKGVADAYMVANYKYNKLNFFQKWFTGEGWDLRNDMANVKNPLIEGKNYLIKHAKTQEDLALAKGISIRDCLHNYAEKNLELVGEHKTALNDINISFSNDIDNAELTKENVLNHVKYNAKAEEIANPRQKIVVDEIVKEFDGLGPVENLDDSLVSQKEQPKNLEPVEEISNN